MKRTNVSLVLGLVMLFLNASLNVQAQSWSLTGSMETARGNLTATLLNNGQVLVAGGRLRGNYNLNTAELYNPSTGTFTPTGHLNAGRNAHAATLLPNGEVLIVGGQDIVNSQINCLSSAELYNPRSVHFHREPEHGALPPHGDAAEQWEGADYGRRHRGTLRSLNRHVQLDGEFEQLTRRAHVNPARERQGLDCGWTRH
jgi:hypothetical protein